MIQKLSDLSVSSPPKPDSFHDGNPFKADDEDGEDRDISQVMASSRIGVNPFTGQPMGTSPSDENPFYQSRAGGSSSSGGAGYKRPRTPVSSPVSNSPPSKGGTSAPFGRPEVINSESVITSGMSMLQELELSLSNLAASQESQEAALQREKDVKTPDSDCSTGSIDSATSGASGASIEGTRRRRKLPKIPLATSKEGGNHEGPPPLLSSGTIMKSPIHAQSGKESGKDFAAAAASTTSSSMPRSQCEAGNDIHDAQDQGLSKVGQRGSNDSISSLNSIKPRSRTSSTSSTGKGDSLKPGSSNKSENSSPERKTDSVGIAQIEIDNETVRRRLQEKAQELERFHRRELAQLKSIHATTPYVGNGHYPSLSVSSAADSTVRKISTVTAPTVKDEPIITSPSKTELKEESALAFKSKPPPRPTAPPRYENVKPLTHTDVVDLEPLTTQPQSAFKSLSVTNSSSSEAEIGYQRISVEDSPPPPKYANSSTNTRGSLTKTKVPSSSSVGTETKSTRKKVVKVDKATQKSPTRPVPSSGSGFGFGAKRNSLKRDEKKSGDKYSSLPRTRSRKRSEGISKRVGDDDDEKDVERNQRGSARRKARQLSDPGIVSLEGKDDLSFVLLGRKSERGSDLFEEERGNDEVFTSLRTAEIEKSTKRSLALSEDNTSSTQKPKSRKGHAAMQRGHSQTLRQEVLDQLFKDAAPTTTNTASATSASASSQQRHDDVDAAKRKEERKTVKSSASLSRNSEWTTIHFTPENKKQLEAKRKKLKLEIEKRRRQIEENIRLQNELKRKKLAKSEIRDVQVRNELDKELMRSEKVLRGEFLRDDLRTLEDATDKRGKEEEAVESEQRGKRERECAGRFPPQGIIKPLADDSHHQKMESSQSFYESSQQHSYHDVPATQTRGKSGKSHDKYATMDVGHRSSHLDEFKKQRQSSPRRDYYVGSAASQDYSSPSRQYQGLLTLNPNPDAAVFDTPPLSRRQGHRQYGSQGAELFSHLQQQESSILDDRISLGGGGGILQPLHLDFASEDHMFDCFQRDVEKLEAGIRSAGLSSTNASEAEETPQRKRDSSNAYPFPVKRVLLTLDPKERLSAKNGTSSNGYGVRIIGGKMIPGERVEIGAFVAKISSGPQWRHLREALKEGDRVLEWNGIKLGGKTYEDVQKIVATGDREVEMVIKNEDEGAILSSDSAQQLRQRSKNLQQQQLGTVGYEEVRPMRGSDRERSQSSSSGAHYSRLKIGHHRGGGDDGSAHYASDNEADRILGGIRHNSNARGGAAAAMNIRLSSSLYDNVENSPRSSYMSAAEKEVKRMSKMYSGASNYANPPMHQQQHYQQQHYQQQLQYNSNTESESSSPLVSHYSPNRGAISGVITGNNMSMVNPNEQQQYYRNAYNVISAEQVKI